MNNPLATHTLDQLFAHYRSQAACFGQFYQELRTSWKIKPDHALSLTLAYMKEQFGLMDSGA